MRSGSTFGGDKKEGQNLLGRWERAVVRRYVDRVPSWIETHHLTYTTLLWSAGAIAFGYAAQFNWAWLWGISGVLVAQYLTDLFDGAVGRHRNTGLVKWGYYMDHLLDYVFLCALLIGYSFVMPGQFFNMYFFVLAILGAFMVNSYLAFAATNKFRISYWGVGPTEVRILFLVINTLLIVFGKTYLSWTLPAILVLATVGLAVVVTMTQREIWKTDMNDKKKGASK